MTIIKRNNPAFPNLFDQFLKNDWPFQGGIADGASTVPAVNIKENKDGFTLELAAPGFKKDDLKVDVEDQVLILSAELKDEKVNEGENYTRREFNYNSFKRSFTLPDTIDLDRVDASFNDGLLVVSLPKKEELTRNKQKQIAIK